MAEINGFGLLRHLRADASSHVLHYRNARLVRSGRGLAFWFSPFSASLAELPIDDREVSLTFHGRSADFQDVVVQGVLMYRIVEPQVTAGRVDFTIDPRRGVWVKQPLETLASALAQLAQQHALASMQTADLRTLLAAGPQRVRNAIETALAPSAIVSEMGLEVITVRIASIKPVAEVERALETPARERIAQEADEAAFKRRALAVEKERAIAENELQSQIELARREEQLIEQRGQNARQQATDEAEAQAIAVQAEANQERVRGEAKAVHIKAVKGAKVEAEVVRLEAYGRLAPAMVGALAARELAGKIQRIEHLNVTPDLLGPLMTGLIEAGTQKLQTHGNKP